MIDQSLAPESLLERPSSQPGYGRSLIDATGARVLVVDDEESIRRALGKFLRSRGFEVVTAESGDAALKALNESEFVLMLCDVRMPGLSGVDVVPLALKCNDQLAVMMLTAVNDAPTATQALGSGAMDYL